MMTASASDQALMAWALRLARAQLGRVAPNPAVGCIIVADGKIVGAGVTGDGGRPHAEESALAQAGERAEGASAYVSLEPCNARSTGQRSCAQRLIEAGVARVVVACEDPNPPAAHGVSRLGAAGVEVVLGVLREDAEALNCGFFRRTLTGRPWVTIAGSGLGHDAELTLEAGEDFQRGLGRLGALGATRVFVRAGTPLAAQAVALGLVDDAGLTADGGK